MIRLRDKQGTLLTFSTPNGPGFVEVCDSLGNVLCATYLDSNGFIHMVTSTSPEVDRYKSIFKVEFIPIRKIPDELKD